MIQCPLPSQFRVDQAAASVALIDGILSDCHCHVAKAGAEGEPIPYERQMAELLLYEWAQASERALKQALSTILSGTDQLPLGDVQIAMDMIEAEMAESFGSSVAKRLPKIMSSGYRTGKQKTYSKLRLQLNWSAYDEAATDWLTRHHLFWVGTYYDRNVSAALGAQMADGIKQGLGREALGNRMAEFWNRYPGVPQRPTSYWTGLAANGMNRARNFGLLQSYQDLNIVALRVVAVMDERTSAICREMNGRIIPTQSAIGQRNRMIDATNPEDVKAIAPWVSAEAIAGKSVDEIMNLGVIMPPYHWKCRTTVIEVRSKNPVAQKE